MLPTIVLVGKKNTLPAPYISRAVFKDFSVCRNDRLASQVARGGAPGCINIAPLGLD